MKKKLYLVAFAGMLLAASAHAQTLGIGAGVQGSQNYALNGGIANLLSKDAGMKVRVQAFGGNAASIPMLQTGRLDLQAVDAPAIYDAVSGAKPFLQPMDKLRVIAALGPTYYGLFVRADSKYQKVKDVKGLKISYGFTAQPTLAKQVDSVLANAGMTIKDMNPVLVPSVPNGVDDFIEGKVDVGYFALAGGKVKEADATTGIRWLALDDSKAAEEATQKVLPGSYVDVVEPAAGIVGIKSTTPLLTFDYLVVIGSHVSDEVAYQIAKAIGDHEAEVKKLRAAGNFKKAKMAPKLKGLTYHPGAVRYFREAGVWKE